MTRARKRLEEAVANCADENQSMDDLDVLVRSWRKLDRALARIAQYYGSDGNLDIDDMRAIARRARGK